MYSFLIADDNWATRLGLITIIKCFFTDCITEEAENDIKVLEMLQIQKFDILITDVNILAINQNQLINDALLKQPELKILIFSVGKEELYASHFMRSGAMGYIEKNCSIEELAKAIQSILSGALYISPKLVKSFFTGKLLKKDNPFLALSQKESEICLMICNGTGLTEIAKIKQLSVSTIGTHKQRILKKVGAENLIDLFKIANFHSYLN